jgi:magnesium chelatase subunit D
MYHRRTVLPFTAIVGQKKLKQALILNAVNPGLLGVLIRGEKGTGKSTAVRALADLLPEIEVVECPFNCSPSNPSLQCSVCNDKYLRGQKLDTITIRRKMKVVELPLGATEDRVIGTLDIERALREGIKALEPGILAEVNQGIPYIDEVNLLDDHLVDVLLDAAAMGINVIEREGISVSHPSRFILVGTMNPEEGEIRPQLLDRFGLSVEIKGLKDRRERVEIIRIVEEFETDQDSFLKKYEKRQEELRQRILKARKILSQVRISRRLMETISEICLAFEVHGHRADFLIARAAKTIAAYNLRKNVIMDDIRQAAELVLPHRTRRLPFEEPTPITGKVEQIIRKSCTHASAGPEDDEHDFRLLPDEKSNDSQASSDHFRRRAKDVSDMIGKKAKVDIKMAEDRKRRPGSGRRACTLSTRSGKYIKAEIPDGKAADIAIDATIRAAAARKGNLKIENQDLREKLRARKVSSVIVFVVDASGSMAAMRGMSMAKKAVMELLKDSYQKRDKVSFIAVAGEKAQVLLAPTSSVHLAMKHLKELPTGGRTSLSDGLLKGLQVLKTEQWKNRNIVPVMVLVSDGKGNVPIGTDVKKELISLSAEIRKHNIRLVVIDTNDSFLDHGYNREIAEAGSGQYYRLADAKSANVVDIVRGLSVPEETEIARTGEKS